MIGTQTRTELQTESRILARIETDVALHLRLFWKLSMG